jgi:hypothetical protein
MKRFLFGSKRRKVGTATLGVFLLAGAAVAAWILFAGVTGSVGGKSATAQTVGAIQLTPNTASLTNGDLLSPGATGAAGFDLTNPTPDRQNVDSLSAGAISSSGAGCAAHVVFNTAAVLAALQAHGWPTGTTTYVQVAGAWSADATLPESCQGATFSVALTGTTHAG